MKTDWICNAKFEAISNFMLSKEFLAKGFTGFLFKLFGNLSVKFAPQPIYTQTIVLYYRDTINRLG